jgi:hypothetical protein
MRRMMRIQAQTGMFDPLVDCSCRLSNTLGVAIPNGGLGVGD